MAATAGNNLKLLLQISPDLDVKSLNVMLKHLKQSLGALGKDIKPLNANQINAELSKIQANVKGTSVSFKGLDNSLDKTTQKTQNFAGVLGKAFAFNQIAQSMQMLTSAISQFTAPFVELDKQVKNIGTLGREGFEEFAALASELSVRVPDDAATIANGVYQAISAGMQGTNEELISFVEIASKAGVAGLSDTASAVDGLTSVLNAYKLKASDAQGVADTFFAGIKLGKTSFEELNSSIATFVPLAAASGVSFQEATSAIAKMTTMGTPTAQAATQIRAAMVLIQKGGPGLNKALKEQGRSLEEFQEMMKKAPEDGGGLINTLQAIRDVTEKAGITLPAATGRIEAASAILQLTGENFKGSAELLNNLNLEVAGNAATKAFDVAAESVAAKTAGILSTVQAMFNKAFLTLGTGATTALNTLTQLSPALVGISALGNIIPPGAVGNLSKFATTLVSKVAPSLVTTSTASGAATISFRALWAAITGPIGLIILAIAAIGTALYVLYDNVEEVRDFIDEAFKYVKAVVLGVAETIKSIVESASSVISKLLKGDFSGAAKEYLNAGKKAAQGFVKGYKGSIEKSDISDAVADMNKSAEEAAKISVQVENTEKLDDLVEQYSSVQSEIAALSSKPTESLTNAESERLESLKQKALDMGTTIAKVAPGAVQGVKTAIDENGKLVDSYEINIDKVKELSETQKDMYGDDLKAEQEEYSQGLNKLIGVYESQKQQMDQLYEKAKRLRKEGDDQGARKAQEEYNELAEKNLNLRGQIVDKFKDGVNQTLLTEDAQKRVSDAIGLSQESIKNATDNQKELTSEIGNTGQALADLAAEYNQYFDQLKQDQNQLIGEIQALEYKRRTEGLDSAETKQLNQLYENAKEVTRQINIENKEQESIKKRIGATQKKNNVAATTQAKTQLDLAKEQLDIEKKRINNSLENYKNAAELQRLEQRRSKTSTDDLAEIEKENEALAEKLQSLKDIYKITLDENGKVLDIGIKLKKDENKKDVIQDVQNQIDDINQEVSANKNRRIQVEWDHDVDTEEAQAKLRDFQKEKLKYDIELGIADQSDYLNFLNTDLDALQEKIAEKQKVINETTDAALKETTETQLQELLQKLFSLEKEANATKAKIGKERLEELQDLHEKELEEIQNRYDLERALQDTLINTTESVGTNQLEKEYDKQISLLETQKEKELITEDDYNKRKEELETKHQKKINSIRDIAAGQRLESERQYDLKLLKDREQRLLKEKDAAIKSGDTQAAERISDELDDIKKAIENKGDLITAYSGQLKNSVTEIFGSLFSDEESMKEPWRRMFAVVAGALKEYLTAIATQLVFGEVAKYSATGLTALLLIPAFKGIANAALGKILDPLVSNLLSFSGGGRVDQPTAAIIGDNPYSSEWIFRDFDIKAIIQTSLKSNNVVLQQLFDRIVGAMDHNFPKLIDEFKTFNDHIRNAKGFFKPDEFTAENLMKFVNDAAQMNQVTSDYRNNKISKDEYIDGIKSIELKVKSYANGSPSLNDPELAIVGDSVSKERVLNDPDLKAIIQEATLAPVKEMKTMMGEFISAIRDQKVYILENDIGKSYDKYNYKKVSRERGL